MIFTSELECSPGSLLPSVFSFIGAAPDFVPDNLGKRYRAAAAHQMDSWAQPQPLADARSRAFDPSAPCGGGSRHDHERRSATRISVAAYRVELWNARGGLQHDSMSASTRDALKSHFLSDSEALADMLEIDVPWLATWK